MGRLEVKADADADADSCSFVLEVKCFLLLLQRLAPEVETQFLLVSPLMNLDKHRSYCIFD